MNGDANSSRAISRIRRASILKKKSINSNTPLTIIRWNSKYVDVPSDYADGGATSGKFAPKLSGIASVGSV